MKNSPCLLQVCGGVEDEAPNEVGGSSKGGGDSCRALKPFRFKDGSYVSLSQPKLS
jgi:hypothetical protein